MEEVRIFFNHTQQIKKVDKIVKTESEWKEVLTSETYRITTERGTESPFACTFRDIKIPGIFKCVRCNTDLFTVDSKFDSGAGWPSFSQPISELNIRYRDDSSVARFRTEVLCARCDAHLGHILDDDLSPTDKRYSINSVALKFSTI